jgi:hypothetical protein
VLSFAIVVSHVVDDFEPGFNQAEEAAIIEQFAFEMTSEGFSVHVVVGVAAPAHALLSAVFGDQALKRLAVD